MAKQKQGQLQLIYDEFAERKLEKRSLEENYKTALGNVKKYIEITEQMAGLRHKKKMIEYEIQDQLGASWKELEQIKAELNMDKERMTDVALMDVVEGRRVLVKDKYENEYEPIWSVRFKKIN